MSDQNIALLNTIDTIDDATMETEMEVLVSMESYYEKCIKTLSYMQHDDSIEPLEIFVESAFTDKVKEKASNLGSRVENWAKSETKGGRVKKILVGLVKKLSLLILKIVRGVKNLIQRVSKGVLKMLSGSIKRFDSFLDECVAKMEDDNINEYYTEEYIIQEGLLSPMVLSILASTGKKAIKEIKEKNIDDNDIIRKKESLALKIRKIDKMNDKEKAQLISNVNKMIDKYCETAKEISDKVIDEISDKVCEELDKRNPNETGPEMLDRLNVFLEKMSASIIAALSGVIKGGVSAVKAGKDIAKNLGLSEAQAKKLVSTIASTGVKVMTLANSINNSEITGSETAKALLEILTKRNSLVRVLRLFKDTYVWLGKFIAGKEHDLNEKIWMSDKEKFQYNKDHGTNYLNYDNGETLKGLANDYTKPNRAWGEKKLLLKAEDGNVASSKEITEFKNDIEKVVDEIDSYISRKLKIQTHRQKKLRNVQKEIESDKKYIIDRNNDSLNDAIHHSDRYKNEIDRIQKNLKDSDVDEEYLDWIKDRKVVFDSDIADYERYNEEISALKLKWDIVEDSELDSKYVSLRDELMKISKETGTILKDIFDKEHASFQGKSAKETVKIIAGSFKNFNKAFLNYHAYTAKYVAKQIIQLESIEGSLIELGQMVSKYGDLLVQRSQMTTDEKTNYSDEYVVYNYTNKFIGSIAKVTGFCMTKCISNPTASKKLMDKTIAASIRYLDAELTAEEYSKKIERRDDL